MIASEGAFRLGAQRVLFSTRAYLADNRHHNYSVSLDDRAFFFVKSPSVSGSATQVIVTLTWFEELKRRVR